MPNHHTATPRADDEFAAAMPTLLKQLQLLNRNIERGQSWKVALRNGFIAAVGGVLGTTIVLSIVAKFLQPYFHDIATIRTSEGRSENHQSAR